VRIIAEGSSSASFHMLDFVNSSAEISGSAARFVACMEEECVSDITPCFQ